MEIRITQETNAVGVYRIQLIGQFWEQDDLTYFTDSIHHLLMQGAGSIIIDLSRLSFINSQGLGMLVSAHSLIKNKKKMLAYFKPRGCIKELMEISGFFSFMNIIETEQGLAEQGFV
ncbi:MAG: STAS domain-containing protein [Chitinivibrionales bacterium]|nr:STAS domain-containing protein [Chitinivibrionales bacterium]